MKTLGKGFLSSLGLGWMGVVLLGLLALLLNPFAEDLSPGNQIETKGEAVGAKEAAPTGSRNEVVPVDDRAFWGAPPPMPHRFGTEWDASRCLECHAQRTNVAKRQQALSPVPHAHLSQCQQCHVRVQSGDESVFKPSVFVGLGMPGKGSRATPTSPPTIPHHTFMRENCTSCHGPSGEQRVATPHPYRSQCRQCHVSQIEREYSRFPLR